MIGLFCFEFGTKYIFAYFCMIYILNYINFVGCNMLMRRLPTAEGPMLAKKTNVYFYTMNVLYIVILILVAIPGVGPFCKANAIYPYVFTCLESLTLINAAAHHYMHYKKYWLKWENSPEVQETLGKEVELGFEPIELIKPVFTAQMDTYICF